MCGHSPPGEYTLEKGGRKVPRTTGRRAFFALAFGSLGCSVGFGLASSWNTAWTPHTQCVAHFDVPRPLFLEEARVVTVTAHAPAASVVVPPLETASPLEELLLLNGPPTAAFKGVFKCIRQCNRSLS
jgi:hypothetical protein